MKIICPTKELKPILQQVVRVVPASSAVAVTQYIKVAAMEDGHILVSATDYDRQIEFIVPGKIEHAGNVTVPAKELVGIVSRMPGEAVTLEAKDQRHTTVKSGKSHYKLNGFEPDSFPDLSGPEDPYLIELPAAAVEVMVERCAYAICRNDRFPAMCGALLQIEGGFLVWVTTDQYRLAFIQYDLGAGWEEVETQIIVPESLFVEIGRLQDGRGDSVTFAFDDNTLTIYGQDYRLTGRLLPGRFPDWKKLQGEDRPHTLMVYREELLGAVQRLKNTSVSDCHRLRLKTSGEELILQSSDEGTGSGEERLDVSRTGDDLECFVNAQQLIEVLKSQEGITTVIDYSKGDRPLLIAPDSFSPYHSILMPLSPW